MLSGSAPIAGSAPRRSITSEFASLRSLQVWLALLSCTLIMGGVLAAYSFIAPLLIDRAGLPSNLVPLALVGFGVGALIGSFLGGRLGDTHPYTTTLSATAATAIILLAICISPSRPCPPSSWSRCWV